MQERNSVPLGHKIIALLVAVAVAAGVHTWFNRNTAHSTSAAELSFDPTLAHGIDPGLADTSDPAVAVAQSMLTDQVIAGLSSSAYLSSSTMASRIGEFRSRLELTQPSAQSLLVRFHDTDPAKSAATANAVAKTLTAPPSSAQPSTAQPQSSGTSTPPAVTPPSAPPAAPAKQPAAPPSDQSANSLSAALGDLAAQLSSTDRQLDRLSSPDRRSHARQLPSYTQSRQQQLLKAGVRAAQKQFDNLRAQYATQGSGAFKDRLAEIQQELSSILLSGNPSQRHTRSNGFNAVGINASGLREERAQLTHAISVIQTDRQAIQREEASSGSKAASPPISAPAPAPAMAAQAPASPQQQPAPTPSPAPAFALNPFILARLAGTPDPASEQPASWWPSRLPASWWPAPGSPASWWPAALAGLLSALLYLAFAARGYRTPDYEEDDSEPATYSSSRLITPDTPFIAPTPPAPPAAYKAESAFFDPTPSKRASFTFDPPSSQSTSPDTAPSESDPSISEPEDPSPTAQSFDRSVDPPHPFRENVVEIGDPWADQMAKTLSQTEIGRMLETSAPQQDKTGTNQETHDSQRSSGRPDRLAG
jgi:hypothetical protein